MQRAEQSFYGVLALLSGLFLRLSRLTLRCSFRNLLDLDLLCLDILLFRFGELSHWLSFLLSMRVINPTLKLIHNNLIFLKLAMMVPFVPYPMMLIRSSQVRTQLVNLLQWQLLRNLHLTFFLSPFFIIQFNYPQVLKLKLLVFTPTCFFFTMFLIVRVEVLLLIFGKGILFRHAVDIEIPYLFDRLAEAIDLNTNLFGEFWHLELFLKLQILIDLQHVFKVIMKKRSILPLAEVQLFLKIEGKDRTVKQVPTFLLQIEFLGQGLPCFVGKTHSGDHLTAGYYLLMPILLQSYDYLQEQLEESPVAADVLQQLLSIFQLSGQAQDHCENFDSHQALSVIIGLKEGQQQLLETLSRLLSQFQTQIVKTLLETIENDQHQNFPHIFPRRVKQRNQARPHCYNFSHAQLMSMSLYILRDLPTIIDVLIHEIKLNWLFELQRRKALDHLNRQPHIQNRVVVQLALSIQRDKSLQILHNYLEEQHLLLSLFLVRLNAANDQNQLLQQNKHLRLDFKAVTPQKQVLDAFVNLYQSFIGENSSEFGQYQIVLVEDQKKEIEFFNEELVMQLEELRIETMLVFCAVLTVVLLRPGLLIFKKTELKKDIEGKIGLLDETSNELLLGVLMSFSLYCILVEQSIDYQGMNRLVQGFHALADQKIED